LVKRTHGTISYDMTVISDDGDHVVVEGPYAGAPERDLGFVVFEVGDWFVEHYWRRRWYSIKEVQDRERRRKGWYCDVTRPAQVAAAVVTSVDLDLDLWVSADGSQIVVLDEDEFAASGLEDRDPDAAARAREALVTLSKQARTRFERLLGIVADS